MEPWIVAALKRARGRVAAALLFLSASVLAFANTPPRPPLKVVAKSCEAGRDMCAYAYPYFVDGDLAGRVAERYLARGCGARDLASCYHLGLFHLGRCDARKAWLPLAQACFVGHNLACHKLRDEGLAMPPIMLRLQPGGKYDALDARLVARQRELKMCYQASPGQRGVAEMEITITAGEPSAKVLRSTLDARFADCLSRRIESLLFDRRLSDSFRRTFEYSPIPTGRRE